MRKWLAAIAVVTALIGGAAYWVLESSWLKAAIEQRAVRELESATGATIAVNGFAFDWRRLRFHAGPVIVRGTESADRDPLLRIESLEVGLAMDLALRTPLRVVSIIAESPIASVYVAPDGTTNLPASSGDRPLPEALAELELTRLEIRNGELRWNDRRIPIDVRATGVAARSEFVGSAREYRALVSAERIEGAPLPLSAGAEFTLAASRLSVQTATLRTGKSSVELSGEVTNWTDPQAAFAARVQADLAEVAQAAGARDVTGGFVEGTLMLRWGSGVWRATGPVRGSNVSARLGGEAFRDVSMEATIDAGPAGARLEGLTARAMGGDFRGLGEVQAWRRFRVEGEVRGVEIPGDLAARISGRLQAAGSLDGLETASAKLTLTPTDGAVRVAGTVDAEYGGGDVVVRRSALFLGGTQVNLSGALRQGLALRIRSCDAGEMLPVLRLLFDAFPEELPFSLDNQQAEFAGAVLGSLDELRVSGRFTAARFRVANHVVEHVTAEGEAGGQLLTLRRASFERNGTSVALSGSIALRQWRIEEGSAIDGVLKVERADIAALAKDFRLFGLKDVPLSGIARAEATVRGTLAEPTIAGIVRASRGEFAGEAFESASAQFDAAKDRVTITAFEAARGNGRLRGSGAWTPVVTTFSASAQQWDLSHRVNIQEPVAASGRVEGLLQFSGGRWQPKRLEGSLEVRAKSYGGLTATVSTQGEAMSLSGRLNMFGAAAAFESAWRMEPGLPGGGTIQILSLTQSAIERAAGVTGESQLPFEAQVEGGGTISGKLLEPQNLAAQFQLTLLRVTPRQRELPAGATAADLTLRNSGPVILAAGSSGIVIQQAKFTAKETELDATGNVSFRRTDQMNFLLRGNVNLAVLDAFNPDIAAAGRSTLNLRLRGPVKIPRMEGRLAFENASFNLRGLPNGLDNVNGAVIFDRNRASVDGLRGQSGGGDVVLNGYVGFGSELSYQLQMALNKVRVRYPEGVSTQANATLVLAGTSRRSLLSGNVTLLRGGLTPSTDIGGLLAVQPPAPQISEGAPDFRRGLQLDLRVETGQSAQFATELTKNLEADVDLRVRGTALRPVVLGRVSITQGSVQFFGTDYSINRGEVNFLNPVSVEPQVDLDLETRVRGILVAVSFSGPLNRMTMSYRSDPPLQSSEILALLAVGRAPTSATTLGFSSVRGNDLLSAGGTAVLSSALTQGGATSGQLQRFFGVTRLKIDPQLIGLDNTPQSRISFEQPISRDVTVTYSQTLARAQGQLVRVQWDLNRQWSALLTRDENGIVSVDFVFRKSFR